MFCNFLLIFCDSGWTFEGLGMVLARFWTGSSLIFRIIFENSDLSKNIEKTKVFAWFCKVEAFKSLQKIDEESIKIRCEFGIGK